MRWLVLVVSVVGSCRSGDPRSSRDRESMQRNFSCYKTPQGGDAERECNHSVNHCRAAIWSAASTRIVHSVSLIVSML